MATVPFILLLPVVLIILLVLGVVDPFKIYNLPDWVKVFATAVWLGITILGFIVMWVKPADKKADAEKLAVPPTASTSGANSPIYQAGRDIVFPGGQIPDHPREVDLAELATTTRHEEAVIMDYYARETGGLRTREEDTKDGASDVMVGVRIALVRRGIITVTPLATKPLEGRPGASLFALQNAFLTPKGRKLAEDIKYLREHPELKVFRPME